MSLLGWYNSNEFRSYPLQEKTVGTGMPDSAVVDFGCMMGVNAGFVDGTHKVWLYRVDRVVDSFTFEFRSDAPGLTGRSLIFQRTIDDPEYACQFSSLETVQTILDGGDLFTDYVGGFFGEYLSSFLGFGTGTSSSSMASENDSCAGDAIWEGFLVTGRFDDLGEVLLSGESFIDEDGLVPVEPALIQNLARTYVRSLNLANQTRTVVTVAEDCTQDWSAPSGIIVNSTCITGKVKFKPGYNCSIRISTTNNSVQISGAVGAGEGEPCEETPIYLTETSPDGGTLLSGGPACSEIITSINGIGGRVIRFEAGVGINIRPAEVPHTLLIEADLHGLAICADVEEA